MKYTVTIKDNETGEIVLNDEGNSVIGTIGRCENGEHSFSFSHGTILELSALLLSEIKNIEKFEQRNPNIALIVSTYIDEENRKEK